MNEKVKFTYTKEDLYHEFIEKLNTLQINAEEANKPVTNLRSTAQSIRDKLMGSLRMKSK